MVGHSSQPLWSAIYSQSHWSVPLYIGGPLSSALYTRLVGPYGQPLYMVVYITMETVASESIENVFAESYFI